MSDGFHVGDRVVQHGEFNIGIIKSQSHVDPETALSELVNAVQALRSRTSDANTQIIDDSMEAVAAGDNVDRHVLRRALEKIATVAKTVGDVGAPVIESVRKVMSALGM